MTEKSKDPKKLTESEQLERREKDRAVIMNIDLAKVEARVFASQKPTEGDLQLIRSPKHPGDIFVKVKGTKKTFICKFYGGNSGVSVDQAVVNVHRFLECWNNYDKLLDGIKDLEEELEQIHREQDFERVKDKE